MQEDQPKYHFKKSVYALTAFIVAVVILFGPIRMRIIFEWNNVQAQIKAPAEQKVQELEKADFELRKRVVELEKEATLPMQEKVISEVRRVFSSHAEEALKVADCESLLIRSGQSYDPYRINRNKNGTGDYSVFQINDIHAKRFGTGFKTNWIENIRVAKTIYDEQKWGPWYSSAKCHKLPV